jgi:hypothetical protein
MCAEASNILRAVAADFFFNCWYLEIPSDNRIRHIPRWAHYHAQRSRISMLEVEAYNTPNHQWLKLALSKGPNRVGYLLTWRRKEFQFPKRCVFWLFTIPDDGRNPQTKWFWAQQNNYRMIVLIQKPRLVCHIYVMHESLFLVLKCVCQCKLSTERMEEKQIGEVH